MNSWWSCLRHGKPVLRCFLGSPRSKLLCIGVEFNPSGSLFLRFFVHHISSCWFSSWWKMTWESCELSNFQRWKKGGYIILDSLLDGNCIIVSPLSESTGTLSSPRYMKSVRGHLSPLGSPRDSVKPCGYPTSCHDALRWPKERYQEPVLAAGERTGCVPCNLATQICPSLMGDIQFKLSLQESTLSYSDINTCMYTCIYIYIHKHIYIYTIYTIYIYIHISSHIFTKEVRSTWVSWQFGR